MGIQLIAGASLLIGVYAVASRYPMRVAGPSCIIAVAATVPAALQATHGFGWDEVVVIVSAFVLAALMCGAYVRNRAETIRPTRARRRPRWGVCQTSADRPSATAGAASASFAVTPPGR